MIMSYLIPYVVKWKNNIGQWRQNIHIFSYSGIEECKALSMNAKKQKRTVQKEH